MASEMPNSGNSGFTDKAKGRHRRSRKEVKSPWKTEMQERMYSSKLVQAIRFAGYRRSSMSSATSSSVTPAPSRVVREVADKALAVAARGRSRWSCAILSRRQRKVKRVTRKRTSAAAASGIVRPRFQAMGVGAGGVDEEMGVEKRVRALGRLVPGGQKLPFSALLEETMDYMAALEMQVRAMTALSELLSTAVVARTPTSSAATTAAAAVINPASC